MDDITYFMNRWDFRPDMDGDQTIDTYTVGFSVESTGVSNVEKAAIQGNGLYFESADADQLAADIVAAFTDIIEKAQSFTSATVPASRTTDGDNFYTSFFRPLSDSPFWEGHLKNFEFTASGDILTPSGFCAVGTDIAGLPPCPTNGSLRTDATAFWDAAEEMPAPASRNLFVGFGDTAFGEQPSSWTAANVGDAELGLSALAGSVTGVLAQLQGSPYLLPASPAGSDYDALAVNIVSSIAGCVYGTVIGTDCIMRTTEDGARNILGDIFHSNPVVVGSPNSPLNEASYGAFSLANRERDRVLYTGANGGWLHGFLTGEFKHFQPDGTTPLIPPRHDRGTGEEVMAFMPSQIRNAIWKLELSQTAGSVRSYVAVDGSPIASDAWIYRSVDGSGDFGNGLDPPISTVKTQEQWRTILMGGLRDGGRGYYALDVTDPSDSDYPGYLWEFPCDDCANAANPGSISEATLMGFTWSEPVITRVRVAVEGEVGRHDRWVAVFGAGYHGYGDPNSSAYLDDADANPDFTDPSNILAGNVNRAQGRAIYMVDLTTGELLAKKSWVQTPLDGNDCTANSVECSQFDYRLRRAPRRCSTWISTAMRT